MSRSQLGSAHPQPTPTVTAAGGGNLSGSGTLYFAIQARGRGGWTVPSSLVSVAYSAGDRITVTIPSEARAAGDDIRRWEVSASLTNDATTLQVIGSIDGYALDEETLESLPANLVLSEDTHIGLGVTVVDEAALPSGADILNGQIRFVTALAKFYRYNPRSTRAVDGSEVLTAVTGRWERAFSFSTYVSSTLDPAGGIDRDIRSLGATDILFPSYPADGSPGIPVDFVWFHDPGTSSPLAQGTRFTFSVIAGGQNKANLFSNKLKLTFLGFVNLATGALDKTGDGGIGLMAGVDEEINFVSGKTNLILQKNLPVGSGYLVRVRPQFDLSELRDEIGVSTPVSLYIYPFSQAGSYTEAGAFLGNIVYNEDDRLIVVPGPGLSVQILEGGAIVNSFSFLKNPALQISGFSPNTANQVAAINGNGAAFYRSSSTAVGSSEAIRAIVSTEIGQGQLTVASGDAVVGTGTGSLSVTVAYSSDANGVGTIRADYPDEQLAGVSGKAAFNPPSIKLWVTRSSDGQITEFTESVVAGVNQVFTISSLGDGGVVGAIPSATAANHGLFVPDTPAVTPSDTGGTLAADTYTVVAGFFHDGNQISRIDHTSPPAIGVLENTVAGLLTAINQVAQFGQPFNTFTGEVTDYIPMAPAGLTGVSVVNRFFLKTDVDPMLLYYSIGTGQGELTLVGGGGSDSGDLTWSGLTQSEWSSMTREQWSNMS